MLNSLRSRKATHRAKNRPARSSPRAASARHATQNIPLAQDRLQDAGRNIVAGHRSRHVETGQSAVRIDLIEREGDKAARLQMFLPVRLYLQAGATITINQGEAYPFPNTRRLTNTWIAAHLAHPKCLKEMETGQKLPLQVVDSSVLTVTTSPPLNQFAAVRQEIPTHMFEQNIDESCAARGEREGPMLPRPRPSRSGSISDLAPNGFATKGTELDFMGGYANSGVVVLGPQITGSETPAAGRRCLSSILRFVVQVDVENNETCGILEIIVVLRRSSADEKHNAVVTVFLK